MTCNSCPFSLKPQAETALNLGCLPEPYLIMKIKKGTNKNWTCHHDETKICTYTSSLFDTGTNSNDIATCCNNEICDTTTELINPWIVYKEDKTLIFPKPGETYDNVTIPKVPLFQKAKEKTLDELINELNIN